MVIVCLHSKNYEWVGAGLIRGRILFLSAKAIVRILFEGGHYSMYVRVLPEDMCTDTGLNMEIRSAKP